MTTKSSQIMALHKEGKTTRQIVDILYALPADATTRDRDRKAAYVRVVIRQRKGAGQSPADRAYTETKALTDPEWDANRKQRWIAYSQKWQKTPAGRAYKRQWMRNKRLEPRSANQIG